MCIAVPMKIVGISQDEKTARVCVAGNCMDVNSSLITPKMGDYVLVHAGCAMQMISKETADEIMELFDELEELAKDES